MAVDPAIFDAEAEALGLVRWPDAGEPIMYRRGGFLGPDDGRDDWEGAIVERVWLGIEVMVGLEGPLASLCPALGDRLAFEERRISDDGVPRFTTSGFRAADGDREWVTGRLTRAVCEPDGYCAGGHRCGKLDLGIWRDTSLDTTNDFAVFAEEFTEVAAELEPVVFVPLSVPEALRRLLEAEGLAT